jgi:hypothetical protein
LRSVDQVRRRIAETAIERSPLRALYLRASSWLGPLDDDAMLVEGMRHLAIARHQPQRIRIARGLDRQRNEERNDRFAGQVKIAAEMTKRPPWRLTAEMLTPLRIASWRDGRTPSFTRASARTRSQSSGSTPSIRPLAARILRPVSKQSQA